MTDVEFGKVWRLLSELWPEQSRRRSATVWRVGLQPYTMAAVAEQIMQYARCNKYWPDLADITATLQPESAPGAPSQTETLQRLIAQLEAL